MPSNIEQFALRVNRSPKKLATGATRTYFKCKVKSCTAIYNVTTTPKGEKTINCEDTYHNHHPPENAPVSKEPKAKAMKLLEYETPSKALKGLLNKSLTDSPGSGVPSLDQLKKLRHAVLVKDMPTGKTRFRAQ